MKDNSLLFIGLLLLIISLMSFAVLTDSIVTSEMSFDSGGIPTLAYFTIQSNIITLVWFFLLTVYILSRQRLFRFALSPNLTVIITTYILVTGLIYWLVLVPVFFEPGGSNSWLFKPTNIWNHTMTPLTAVVMFFFVKTRRPVSKPKPKLHLFYLYPTLYIALGIYYALNGKYLYPMFNPELLGGWTFVALSLAVIIVVFTALYLLMLKMLKKAT